MTFFRKIREWYYETMNMYRQISLDNKNRKLYLRTVREECIDPQSRFVKMNLKLADDQESLVYGNIFLYLLQLFHHAFIDMKTSGRIEYHDIVTVLCRKFKTFLRYLDRTVIGAHVEYVHLLLLAVYL